jgi:hypothetical protein
MYRRVMPLGLVILAACLSLAWCVPIDKAAEEKAKEAEGFTPKKLIAGLNKRISLDKVDGLPLKDVLEVIGDKTELPIIVDEKAFDDMGLPKVMEQPIALPHFKATRAATILRLVAKQLRGETGYSGACLVRGDNIEMTSTYHAWFELTGTEIPQAPPAPMKEDAIQFQVASDANLRPEVAPVGSTKRLGLPVVHVDFDQKPLREAIQELADSTGATIIVDGRLGDKAKAPVTVTFTNAFLDTALDLIAEGADLTVVRVDNTFYLTTPENAEKVRKQRPRRFDGGAPGIPSIPGP